MWKGVCQMSLKIMPAVYSNLFDEVFLKQIALDKLLLFLICVKKQCLFCVIVLTCSILAGNGE